MLERAGRYDRRPMVRRPASSSTDRPVRRRRRVRSGRRSLSAALGAVTVAAALAWSPATASAADGYSLRSSAVYRFDPTASAVSVVTTYEMRNTTPDRNVGGGRTEFFFFERLRVPIDESVSDLQARVNGQPAEFAQSEVEGFAVLDVEFPSRLRFGSTATIEVSYRMLGDPPRTDGSFVRVNPAYVAFPVFAFADENAADVRVEIPDDWTLDYVGGEFDGRRREGAATVLEATDIARPEEFGVLFTARQDDQLASTPLTEGDARFEIRAWPGDAEWLAFAQRQISEGVPTLERLVGAPWPENNETDVIQASTPYLRGYAGYYFADTDVIEVGEDLDSHTMLHELSHAWFNDATIADRWISEGLADEIGARAVAALGAQLPAPDDFDDLDRALDLEPFPLNEWDRPAGALDNDAEFYGYRTSFLVMRALYDELGEARMSELVAAVLAGERAYPGETGTAAATGPVDLRGFLDLAEQVGASTGVEQLYRDFVISESQTDDLDRRDELLVRYAALVERGGTWAPPEAVRAAMADWQFAAAGDDIDLADAALDVRDQLGTTLAPIDLEPAASTEAAYQASTDLADTADELAAELDAARRLVSARQALVGHLDGVGLTPPTLGQPDYDTAPLDVTRAAEQLERQAAEVADDVAAIDATLAAYELTMPPLPVDAFAVSPDAAQATAETNRRAAVAVADAYRDRDDVSSVLGRIGSLGSDVDAQLSAAADQLAAGDTAAATETAGAASATLADWNDRGTARLVAVAIGLAIGLTLVTITRRRQRRVVSARTT